MPDKGTFSFQVDASEKQIRLDALIALRIPQLSRSHAAELIRSGRITIGGAAHKAGYRVRPGEIVNGTIPAPDPIDLVASDLPLEILHEDAAIIVVNKSAGMVVHPAAGHATDTLVNALLHHCADLAGIGGKARPGIVHRLDKDTSGVLVAAKNDEAQINLSEQFKARTVSKTYLTVVSGVPAQESGQIDMPVGRHPKDRKKMSTTSRKGREAITLWRVKERYTGAALLEIDLKTGRTHQIRVHCAAMGHPVLGDPVYGRNKALQQSAKGKPELLRIISTLQRQMLHAVRLSFRHPVSGEQLTFEAPMPGDMSELVEEFRALLKGE